MFFPIFSFLGIKPKVSINGDRLIACTCLLFKILTFFAYTKCVTVDRRIKLVIIKKTYFWIFKTKQIIHFNNIKRIVYAYCNYTTDYNSLTLQNTDEIDEFTVSLELYSRDIVKIFSFTGEGAVDTGITGVLLGDDLVDSRGDQEDRSRTYVELLTAFTGKCLT